MGKVYRCDRCGILSPNKEGLFIANHWVRFTLTDNKRRNKKEATFELCEDCEKEATIEECVKHVYHSGRPWAPRDKEK